MKKRTSYKKSEASRQQVIDAAVLTLARKGYADTSVQDIAEEAKLSKGAVHYHFKNKDDLIQNVLTQCCDHMTRRVKAAWGAPGTPAERVRRAIQEMWSARKERGPEMRVIADLVGYGVHNEGLRGPLAQMFRKNREEIMEAGLKDLMALGLKARVPLDVIPRLLLASLDGLALHAVFDPLGPHEETDALRALELVAFSLFEI